MLLILLPVAEALEDVPPRATRLAPTAAVAAPPLHVTCESYTIIQESPGPRAYGLCDDASGYPAFYLNPADNDYFPGEKLRLAVELAPANAFYYPKGERFPAYHVRAALFGPRASPLSGERKLRFTAASMTPPHPARQSPPPPPPPSPSAASRHAAPLRHPLFHRRLVTRGFPLCSRASLFRMPTRLPRPHARVLACSRARRCWRRSSARPSRGAS